MPARSARRRVSAPVAAIVEPLQPRRMMSGTAAATPYIVNAAAHPPEPAVGIVGDGCSGTLIAPQFVLTAAHCVQNDVARGTTVTIAGETYRSTAITIHPRYQRRRFDEGFDLAVIELERPVAGVAPIELLRQPPTLGESLTLVGFGTGGRTGDAVPVGDFGTQRTGTTPLDTLTTRQVRWRIDAPTEANAGPGDSGGAVLVTRDGQPMLAAVISGGYGDSHTLGGEAFNTRVDAFADWIDSVAGTTPPRLDDVLAVSESSGAIVAATSDGGRFLNSRIGTFDARVNWSATLAGDFNGDGRDDLARMNRDTGVWTVALRTDAGTRNVTFGRWAASVPWTDHAVGDFDGDGLADVAARSAANGSWYVGLSTGERFDTRAWGRWNVRVAAGELNWGEVRAADVDGDGRDDLIGRERVAGGWWAALSDGSQFRNRRIGRWTTAVEWDDVQAADIDADGRLELLGRNRANGAWYLLDSDADGAPLRNRFLGKWSTAVRWADVHLVNADDDAELELVGRVVGSGVLWTGDIDFSRDSSFVRPVLSSRVVATSTLRGDAVQSVAGDFDGDGRRDVAFFSETTGVWSVLDEAENRVARWGYFTSTDWDVVVGDV